MIQTNIIEYFEGTAARVPEKTAVIDGERTIAFSDLRERALKLATVVRQSCSGAIRRPVAVYLEKSIESVVSDLGIVYSGNAYMNLDVKTPMQRIGNILELVEPALVVTTDKYAEKLPEIWPAERTVFLDHLPPENLDETAKSAIFDSLNQIIDTDPLCLINTSGSTGTPKSVALNHRSFIDFTEQAVAQIEIGENERIGSLSPIVFDIFSFELCMMMAKAGTIVVLPDTLAAFPAKLLQYMQDQRITFIFWVPTIMVNIANMDLLSRIALPDLKMIWFAGEVFPTRQFNYWKRNLPHAVFVNLYGPIEITLDCTYFIVDRDIPDDEPLPIGIPFRNTDVLVLNEEDRLAGVNEEGEVCVRGSSLALGYYNNPEKTSAAFTQNPLNHSYPEPIYRTGDLVYRNERGELMFIGRRDTLVKHSGYRIELGEIEHTVVNTLRLVKNGCAVYDREKKEIVFFYESAKEIPAGRFRSEIGSVLPKYMIPNRFHFLPELPRNANGKIDRLKLKESL